MADVNFCICDIGDLIMPFVSHDSIFVAIIKTFSLLLLLVFGTFT